MDEVMPWGFSVCLIALDHSFTHSLTRFWLIYSLNSRPVPPLVSIAFVSLVFLAQCLQVSGGSRVRHCDWLVANTTKNWALATRNLELVASRRLTFCPLSIWNSKVNGLFLKENIKLPWRIVVKQSDDFTIAIITRRHIVSAASRENVTWRKSWRVVTNKASAETRALNQPCSQGTLSTSRKYPGYGWSRVYTCQQQTHRGWVLNKLQLQLSSPSLRSYLWNLLKSSRHVTSRNQGTFSR